MAKVESFRGFPKPVIKKNTKGEPRALMAYVKVNGKQWAKEFPVGTRASVIIAWQEEEFERRQATADVVAMPGTFAGDVQRYLDLDVITDMASFKARKSDINAWVREFGNTRRDEIKPPAVNKAMAKWKAAGIAANTRRDRLTALNDLWLKLDKREAPWTDEVKAPKENSVDSSGAPLRGHHRHPEPHGAVSREGLRAHHGVLWIPSGGNPEDPEVDGHAGW